MGVTFIHRLRNGPTQLQKNLSRVLVALAAATLLGACNNGRAEAALAALNLDNSPSGRLSWQKRDVSGGKVVFHDAVLRYKSSEISIKTLSLEGLVIDGRGRPELRSFALSGVSGSFADPGLAIALKRMSGKGLNPETGAWAASLLAQSPDADPPAVPPLQSLGFDEVRLAGLVLSNDPKAPGANPAYATLAIENASVSGLANALLKSASLDDLSLSFSLPRTPVRDFLVQGGVDLASLKLEGLRTDQLAARLDRQPRPAASPIDPGFDAFEWKGLVANASGVRFTVPAFAARVKRDGSGAATEAELAPTSATLAVNPLSGRLGQLGGAIFSTLGYERIEARAAARLVYDPAGDAASGRANLAIVDGFDLATDWALQNSGKGEARTPPSVTSFNLNLTDRSLTDRLLALGPLTSGASPAVLREDIATMIEALGRDAATGGVDPAVAGEISKALAAFVRKSGSLNASLRPTAPWSPAADPGFTTPKAKLGLSVSYAPAPAPAAP